MWEVVKDTDGTMARVRWSVPHEDGAHLYVRHYPATLWGMNAVERECDRFNKEGRRPEEWSCYRERKTKMEKRAPVVHEKKCWVELFQQIATGGNCSDIRPDDVTPRYEAGDTLLLREYVPGPLDKALAEKRNDGTYTGAYMRVKIEHVLRNFKGLEPGYCVLSLKLGNNYSGFDVAYAGMLGDNTRPVLTETAPV